MVRLATRPLHLFTLLLWAVWVPASASPAMDPQVLQQKPSVIVSRLRVATVGCPDLESFEQAYTGWLDYEPVERGVVPASLAASWGAPAMAGRDYLLLRPASGADVYIRGVTINPTPDYLPMTTLGWNAFEIIVDDIDALAERLRNSPFQILGPPRSLGGEIASVYAMQVQGPSGEILYFNSVKGDRSKSRLPIPGSQVDRLNIAILGAADARQSRDFYVNKLGFSPAGSYRMPVSLLARANDMPPATIFELLMVSASESGNLLEIDAYPVTARQRAVVSGELPQGNAMLSLQVDSLVMDRAAFLAEPITLPGPLYAGGGAATLRGPSGELVELLGPLSPDLQPQSNHSE